MMARVGRMGGFIMIIRYDASFLATVLYVLG